MKSKRRKYSISKENNKFAFQLFKSAELKVKTEGLIIAAQKQNLLETIKQTLLKMDQTQYVDCANKKLNQLTTSCLVTQSWHQ